MRKFILFVSLLSPNMALADTPAPIDFEIMSTDTEVVAGKCPYPSKRICDFLCRVTPRLGWCRN
jgi:hypothetical protein